VDINPKCKQIEEYGFEIYIGDQDNRKSLKSIMENIQEVDIVINDVDIK
jgi:hypothetical protein